jgi:hypothetical protein
MLKKLVVISLTAGALVLSAPAVASADTGSYADPPGVTVDTPVVDVCESSDIVFGAGYFQPGEAVGVGVSGANAADASYSGNVATDDGGLVLSFRPPADGDGSYDISFDGSRSYTATVTVSHGHDAAVNCGHDPVVAEAGDVALARTGGGVSPWMIGGGITALAAGGVLVAVGITRRKRA